MEYMLQAMNNSYGTILRGSAGFIWVQLILRTPYSVVDNGKQKEAAEEGAVLRDFRSGVRRAYHTLNRHVRVRGDF